MLLPPSPRGGGGGRMRPWHVTSSSLHDIAQKFEYSAKLKLQLLYSSRITASPVLYPNSQRSSC